MVTRSHDKQSLLSIGHLITNGRDRCGLTLSQLAAAVRLTEQTLQTLESGTAKNIDHAGRILGYLLKTYKAKAAIDNDSLAKQIGVVPSAIAELERGANLNTMLLSACFHAIDDVTGYLPPSSAVKEKKVVEKTHKERTSASSEKKKKTPQKFWGKKDGVIPTASKKYKKIQDINTKMKNWAVATLKSMPGIFSSRDEDIIWRVVFLFSLDELNEYYSSHNVKGLYLSAVTKYRELTEGTPKVHYKKAEKEPPESIQDTYRIPRGLGGASQYTRKQWGAAAKPARIKR